MMMTRKKPAFGTIEQYEKHFPADYTCEIIEMYKNEFMDYLDKNVGRKLYQKACRYLRSAKKIGGAGKVNN